VLLGPAGPTVNYPRDKDIPTYLLSEGRLSDGRRVWVVYCTRQNETNNASPPQQQTVVPTKQYLDPSVDFSSVPMRAALFGTQPDGSLTFWDKRATVTKA
jgi:hypothetical protein